MSVNETRSMNQDLVQGKDDGVRKFLAPDRGGEVDLTNVTQRASELPWHYGADSSGFPVKVSGESAAGSCSCQH
jgi:hypothetical protein